MTPLTPTEARQRLYDACDLLRDARAELMRRIESLRNHEANLRAGLVLDDLVYFQHSVEVMQEVVIRLMSRIERLELLAGIYWTDAPSEKYVPTDHDIFMMSL